MDDITKSTLGDVAAELEKCKDPVYFYENYWLVNDQKPKPLRELERELLRYLCGADNKFFTNPISIRNTDAQQKA